MLLVAHETLLAGLAPCTPVVAGNKIPVFAVVLGFQPGFNNDFGNSSLPADTPDKAIVAPKLAGDLRPVYTASGKTSTTSGAVAASRLR